MTIRAGALVDVADFGTAEGVDVPLSGGVTDPNVHAWLQGGLAGIEFECRAGTVTHGTVVGTFPDGYLPPWTATVTLAPNSTTPATVFAQISTTGEISLYFYGAASPTTIFRGSACWPRSV